MKTFCHKCGITRELADKFFDPKEIEKLKEAGIIFPDIQYCTICKTDMAELTPVGKKISWDDFLSGDPSKWKPKE